MDNTTNYYNDEVWEELSKPVRKQDQVPTQTDTLNPDLKPRHRTYSTPVLTIQLVLCLIVLTILFLLKTFSFNSFDDIKKWYDTEMKSTLYHSGDFSSLDYSQLFSSSSDEI